MLNKIKAALRIKSSVADDEITDLIASAKLDLQISGVRKIVESDPLIQRAITLYCKANFGMDNKNMERYQLSYDLLKCSLSLCGDYNVV